MKPIAVQRFPANRIVLKDGDSFECTFTVTMDDGSNFMAVDMAALYGVVEKGNESHAARLAHLADSLCQLRDGLPSSWDDCDPRWHVERALRELSLAMLALDDDED